MPENDSGPLSAPEMAEEEATGVIRNDEDGVETPDQATSETPASGEGPDGPTVESDAFDSDEGVSPESETANLTDDIDPNVAGSSSNFGFNGTGDSASMTGIGASTDTGSNRFISGAGGSLDPGYDKGPVVGDGTEAFPNEVHGLFDDKSREARLPKAA